MKEHALAGRGTSRRHVCGPAIEFLDNAQRREPCAASSRNDLEPPALFLTDICPRDINAEAQTVGAFKVNEHHVLHRAGARLVHVRRDPHRIGKIGKPEGKVEQRISVLKESSAASFGLVVAPSLYRPELVLPRSHAQNAAELGPVQKSRELLYVAAEAMVVSDDHFSVGRSGRCKNPFHSARCQRQWPLAQHVNALLQRTQYVGFVQVVRGRDDYRIEFVGIEQLVDISKDVGDPEALGERPCLGPVVVADRNKLRATETRQQW